MRKMIALVTCLVFTFSLTACGEKKPTTITNDDFVSYMNDSLKNSDYSQYSLANPTSKKMTDKALGECTYRSYAVETGLSVLTFSDVETDKLLKLMVLVNGATVIPSAMEVTGFLNVTVIKYFDSDDLNAINTKLGLDNVEFSALTNATGQNGTYEFAVSDSEGMYLSYTVTAQSSDVS